MPVSNNTPNLDAVKAEINLENKQIHKGIQRQTEETMTKDSKVAQNEPNSDILWPSQ